MTWCFLCNSNIKSLTVRICQEYLYNTSIEKVLEPNDTHKLAKFT